MNKGKAGGRTGRGGRGVGGEKRREEVFLCILLVYASNALLLVEMTKTTDVLVAIFTTQEITYRHTGGTLVMYENEI